MISTMYAGGAPQDAALRQIVNARRFGPMPNDNHPERELRKFSVSRRFVDYGTNFSNPRDMPMTKPRTGKNWPKRTNLRASALF